MVPLNYNCSNFLEKKNYSIRRNKKNNEEEKTQHTKRMPAMYYKMNSEHCIQGLFQSICCES